MASWIAHRPTPWQHSRPARIGAGARGRHRRRSVPSTEARCRCRPRPPPGRRRHCRPWASSPSSASTTNSAAAGSCTSRWAKAVATSRSAGPTPPVFALDLKPSTWRSRPELDVFAGASRLDNSTEFTLGGGISSDTPQRSSVVGGGGRFRPSPRMGRWIRPARRTIGPGGSGDWVGDGAHKMALDRCNEQVRRCRLMQGHVQHC